MIVATPTITHTGTRFLHRRVLCAPFIFKVQAVQHMKAKNVIVHTHMFNSGRPVFDIIVNREYPIVIPLTNPARNLQSMIAWNKPYSLFYEQWKNMMELVARVNSSLMFLHLDDEGIRQQQADAICDKFNLPKVVDWSATKVTGSKHGTHKLTLQDEHFENVPSQFVEFYNTTKEVN